MSFALTPEEGAVAHEPTEARPGPQPPALIRRHNATFGPYLRELRVGAGLSLRDAAARLGISFAKLQKMETGGRFRIRSLDLLDNVADLFNVERREVRQRAGFMEIDEIKVGEGASVGDAIERAHARGVVHGWEAALAAIMEASRPLPCQADVHRLVMWVKELAVRRGSPAGERP
ncbi:MAG: helix-turn-helix domain-containing protein [Deltaproteobacteria bacterium]|nr:helix-turn-helix domain-containing protein [Deltaproteobacteria bacterium]